MICIGVFILLILLNLIFGSSTPVPYYPDNIFAKQFPYTREGMEGENNNDPDPEREDKEEDENQEEGYSEEKEDSKKDSKKDSKNSNDSKKSNNSKKESFQGLPSGSFNNEQYIGYLANVKTGVNCGGISNGYSNSTGYFCLSPEEIRYLQSRGGNATSKGDF